MTPLTFYFMPFIITYPVIKQGFKCEQAMKSRMSHVLICNNYNVSVSKRANVYKRYDFITHFATKIVVNTTKSSIFLKVVVADFHYSGRFPGALPLAASFAVLSPGSKGSAFPQESPLPFQSVSRSSYNIKQNIKF